MGRGAQRPPQQPRKPQEDEEEEGGGPEELEEEEEPSSDVELSGYSTGSDAGKRRQGRFERCTGRTPSLTLSSP